MIITEYFLQAKTDDNTLFISKDTIKVLEENGWKFAYTFQETIVFEKGDLNLDAGRAALLYINGNKVKIITTDEGYNGDGVPDSSVKFDGLCQTIEEFNMICKMINLKA
jgi:hypothetical protein